MTFDELKEIFELYYSDFQAKILFLELGLTGTMINRHSIYRISGMIVIDREIEETFDFSVQPNPASEISSEFLDRTGMTWEQLFDNPSMKDVYGKIVKILAKYVGKTKTTDSS